MNTAIMGTFEATFLAALVAGSVAIAFVLEWMCLRGVMALMPARRANTRQQLSGVGGQTKLTRSFALGQKH
ncbi:MAG: hypothetical protein ACYDD2_00770 [Candidatus Acidiferrales bacterium]